MVYGNNYGGDMGTGLTDMLKFNQAASKICQATTTRLFAKKGHFWALQDPQRGGGFCMANTPNTKACYYRDGANDGAANSLPDTGDSCDSLIGASSAHPGGVNCLFMDGSVKFIKNSINLVPWLAIGSLEGGEPISSDSY
jgi:prepilin-type processing-associated H-X9-DG protein